MNVSSREKPNPEFSCITYNLILKVYLECKAKVYGTRQGNKMDIFNWEDIALLLNSRIV